MELHVVGGPAEGHYNLGADLAQGAAADRPAGARWGGGRSGAALRFIKPDDGASFPERGHGGAQGQIHQKFH
jgi:hypothetical protein